MGNTKLNFDIEQLMQLNSEVSNSRTGIANNFSKVKNLFEELSMNVTGTQVNNLITTITENLTAINKKMDVSFEELTTFLNGQMSNYSNTYEGAKARLNQALQFIGSKASKYK